MTVVRAQVGTSNGGYEESLGGLPWAAAVPLVTPEVFRVRERRRGETLDTAPHSGVARPDVPRRVQFYEPAVNKMSPEENCVRARLRDLAFAVASDLPEIGSPNPAWGDLPPGGRSKAR